RGRLRLERIVPQVRVKQPHHWLINVADAKNEIVPGLLPGLPDDRHQHVSVVAWYLLNNWRTAFADLFPKIIERLAVTRFDSISQSCQARTQGQVVNCLRAFSSGGRGLGLLLLAE